MQSDATPGASPPAPRSWIADRLDVRLGQRRVDRAQLAGLIEALASLHAERAAGPALTGGELVARAERRAARLGERAPGLRDAVAARVASVRAAVEAAGPALAARAARPGVRRLHGALVCEHIHADPRGRARLGPPAPGAAGDPLEDVAALAVLLAARGRADLARAFVNGYAEATGDFGLYRALDAHLALAALVAAHGALAGEPERGGADPIAAAERLLAAPALLGPPAEPVRAIATCGAIASGKSTLAARLSEMLAAPRVSGDAARAVADAEAPPSGAAAVRTLGPGADDAVYADLLERAGDVVASGRPVVIDACFPTRARRDALRAWAQARGIPLLFVECRAEAGLTRRRLEERARRQGCAPSEWLALRDRLLAAWEPIKELPREQHLPVDTAREPEACLARIAAALERIGRPPHRVRRSAAPRGVPVSQGAP